MIANSVIPATIKAQNERNTAKTLKNSLHIVVPHGGHGLGGLEGIECIDRINTEFIERGTTKDIDTSCVKSIRRKGFAMKFQ